MSTATQPARHLRVAVFAVVASVLAAAGHAIAGHGAPAAQLVVGAAILPWIVGAALTHRRLTMGSAFASLAAIQVSLHLVFELAAAGTPATGMSLDSMGAPMVLHPVTWQMLLAHFLAWAATAFLLVRGDRATEALASWVASRISRWLESGPHVAPGPQVLAALGPAASATVTEKFPAWGSRAPPR